MEEDPGIRIKAFNALSQSLLEVNSEKELESCLSNSLWSACGISPLYLSVLHDETENVLFPMHLIQNTDILSAHRDPDCKKLQFSLQEADKCIFLYSWIGGEDSIFVSSFLRLLLSETLSRVLSQKKTGLERLCEEKESNIESDSRIAQLNRYYFKLLNDLPGQIAVFDKNLRYRYINQEAVKDKDLRKWLIGKNDIEYCNYRGVDPAIGRERQVHLLSALNEKRRFSFSEKIQKPDGKVFHIFRVVSPIFDDAGNVEGLFGYSIDITDQKLAEEERDRFFNISLDLLCIVGADGYFKRINPAFEQTFGFNMEELLAAPVSSFVYPEDLAIARANFSELFFGSKIRSFENRFICKNKEVKWVSWKANAVIDSRLIYAVGRDVTEQKWVEQELINAKTLAEDSTMAKEEFLAHMSHEIKTPLNAIIGMTDLMLANRTPAKNPRYLKNVKTAADNLLVLINDILDFSKINSGKIELDNLAFSLPDLIVQSVEIMEIPVQEKGLSLSYAIDEKIPPVLIGDPNRINQIIMNFLSNAIKFTEHGEVKLFSQLTKDFGEEIEFLIGVTDLGIGIPPEKLEHIFESFVQVRSSGYTMQQGAGLGLTITKKLAEMHNGRVEVTSEFGKGSTFTAYLRLKKGKLLDLPESDNKSDENEAGPLAGVSVLVVEDNELNQVVVCNMLENWGATHAVAKNGQEAISILEAARFHIVLMDLAMPIMDGFEATAYIRSRMSPPASTLPIIALTASAVLDVQKRTLAAGMNDYVSKPFRSKTLLQKILENLKNNVKLPQNADLPNEARGESVLDLSYLREVSSDNDELLLRMLNEAEKNFNEFVKTGSIYIAEQDYTKLRLLAHKIKPVCRYIGSDKMFHEISKIEIAAKNETEKEELLDYYWKFMEAWGESRKLLEAEIARLKKE